MIAVYVITNKINGKQYVGQTKNSLRWRFLQHCAPSKAAHCELTRAIVDQGRDNFSIDLIEMAEDRAEADIIETREIKARNSFIPGGYNIFIGGTVSGHYVDSRVIQMSERQKGNLNSFYGRNHTEETKNKISKASSGRVSPMKGRKMSDEAKAKLSASCMGRKAWNKGQNHTEETKRRISEAAKKRSSSCQKG